MTKKIAVLLLLLSAGAGARAAGTYWNVNASSGVANIPFFFGSTTTIKGPSPYTDIRAHGAVGDGTTNDRAALAAADTLANGAYPILLTPGTYKISTSLTVASPVIFAPGAIIAAPSGSTVTFTGALSLPDQKVFALTGTGFVKLPRWTSTYDVRWWGALGNGSKTDNQTPINQAVTGAYESSSQNGAVVWVPSGNYLVSGQVTVKNKVILKGSNCRDTEIEINTATWNGDTHLLYFDGASALFNTRAEDLTLKVNSTPTVTSAVYSNAWNEQSGLKRMLISGFTGIGILSEGGTGGSAVYELEELELGGSDVTSATTGISLATDATVTYANAMLRHITIAGGSSHFLTNAVAVSSRVICNIEGLHGEQTTSVVTVTGSSHLVGHGLTGSVTGVTNVVRVDTNFNGLVHLTGARASGASVLLLDQKTGLTLRNSDVAAEPLTYPILAASKALASDASGNVATTAVTSTELGYVSGVSSALQTQLNAKEGTITTLSVAKGGTNSGTALSGSSIMTSNGSAIVQGAAGTSSTLLHGNAAGAPTYGAVALGSEVSGTLPVGNGGTNSATALSGSSIMVSNGSAVIQGSAGTSTTLLHGNASGTPTYSAVSLTADVTGTLGFGNGGTGATSFTSGSIPFSNGTIFTQSNSNLFWDSGNSRLGIGTNGPGYPVEIKHDSAPDLSIHYSGASAAGNKGHIYFTHNRNSDSTQETLSFIQGVAEDNQSTGGMRFVTRANADVEVMRLWSTGHVGIGSASDLNGMLQVLAADNGIAAGLKINATQANVTTSDVFAGFYSTSGLEGSVAGTGVAGVIAFNTFTGAHWTRVVGPKPKLLAPICSTGNPYKAARKEQLVESHVCTERQDKAVLGFFAGTDKDGQSTALALGTGLAWVLNTGKDVESGDWLVTSGDGETVQVQADDLQHNYSAAKALQPIKWKPGEKTRKIAVTYHAG